MLAKDSERLIVNDEKVNKVDLFGDIFPKVVLAAIGFGAFVYGVFRLIGWIL